MTDSGGESSDVPKQRSGAPAGWLTACRVCYVIVGIVCLVPALFPADAQFVADEPLLLEMALQANSEGRLAPHGLGPGHQGITYGPFSVWLYQLYLLFSHRLVGLVLAHALLIAFVTAAGLLWLQRELSLWPWFAVPLLLSPHIWFYSRVIWDNPFNIPLSALILAAAARLLRAPTAWAAALLAFSMVALVLTHLMGVATVIAVAAVLLACRFREMWAHRMSLVLGALPLLVAALPYWAMVRTEKAHGLAPLSSAWLFPLDGPRFISAAYIERYFGTGWLTDGGWPVAVARATTLIAYPLCLAGACLTLGRIVRAWRRSSNLPTREAFGVLLLAVLLSQFLLNGLTGQQGRTQYFSATWIAFGVFAWLAAEVVRPRVARTALVFSYAASLAIVVAALGWSIHVAGGTRGIYGPTIGNQIALAEALRRYPAETLVRSEAPNLERFPQALRVMRTLTPPNADAKAPPGPVWIRYRSPDPDDARLELVVHPSRPAP